MFNIYFGIFLIFVGVLSLASGIVNSQPKKQPPVIWDNVQKPDYTAIIKGGLYYWGSDLNKSKESNGLRPHIHVGLYEPVRQEGHRVLFKVQAFEKDGELRNYEIWHDLSFFDYAHKIK